MREAERRLGKQAAAPESRRSTSQEELTEAIWHMLTNNEPFAPAPGGVTLRLAA